MDCNQTLQYKMFFMMAYIPFNVYIQDFTKVCVQTEMFDLQKLTDIEMWHSCLGKTNSYAIFLQNLAKLFGKTTKQLYYIPSESSIAVEEKTNSYTIFLQNLA